MKLPSLVAALFASTCLMATASLAGETITLAADTWCPYTCTEGGYMVEIARDIFQKNHIDIDYRVIPWKDAVDKARSGEIDGVIGAAHGDAPDFIFPDALEGMSDMRFWVLQDSVWSYSGLPSLDEVRLAVVEDYSYSKDLNDYIKTHADDEKRIYQAKGSNKALEENLDKLKSKEVDVLAEDDNVVNYFISAQGADYPIKSAGSPIKRENMSDNFLYIAFSPKNPKAKQYADMLDAGMKSLRDSGELRKILEIYHVNDWYGIAKK